MIENNIIDQLRYNARKLVRELGILEIDKSNQNRSPQHWHALIEIVNHPRITMSKLGKMLLLSPSSISRVCQSLLNTGMILIEHGEDKREKYLCITKQGKQEIEYMDKFSNEKIIRAFKLINKEDQDQIIAAIKKYADALEESRLCDAEIKIHALSTSRTLRKQIIDMITQIQRDEFLIPITPDINKGILKAENEYYFNKSYNFWYATDQTGKIIGSIGLKQIDQQNAEIKKLFVDHAFRGLGVADKLLSSLLNAALKHGFSYLYLGTVDVLKAAQRFYQKNGFEKIQSSQLPANFDKCALDTDFYKFHVHK